ncbi:kinase-like domain-containing protein [Mycena maculata]|uniref:non-specific serine/threonine protein kinase n=1 Tax=Mycena maculata TaxID=230809 RepID=A0AAD7H9V6_9AGAR|nr:kinase-like domain-containing protein [Mycena maculata]
MPQSGTLANLMGSIVDDGRLKLVSLVGAGAYGKLYRALDTSSTSSTSSASSSSSSSPRFYAVKCLRKPAFRSRDAKFQDRERTLHRRVSAHPNIVTLHRLFTDREHVFLVLEFCAGGDMFHAITDGVYHKNTELIRSTFASLVEAVLFLHSRGVYHRDLKPENVLTNHAGGSPLIADFGLATPSKISHDMDCGSGSYMTPESFSSASSTYCPPQSDVWALCITLINLVSAMNPWRSAQASDARWNSFLTDPDFLREIIPISTSLTDLLLRCFRLDAALRPSLVELGRAVHALPDLYMTDAELKQAAPAVRRAAGWFVPGANAYDASDYSSPSTSGSGYSSIGPQHRVPPAGLAASSALAVPDPAASSPRHKVPFHGTDPSSVADSINTNPQGNTHLLQLCLPSLSISASSDPCAAAAPPAPGKFKRLIRRLRAWRKL